MSKEGRQKALETTLAGLNKRYGEGVVMKLGEASRLTVQSIPTGSLSLDIALGVCGVPRGRIIEIYGPESSGKTTLCLHVIAEAQKQGGICGFVDVEHALDPAYAAKIGVVGGIGSVLQGARFGDGFRSAGISSLVGSVATGLAKGMDLKTVGQSVTRIVAGGTASALTGGKFVNGAAYAAFATAAQSLAQDHVAVTGGENLSRKELAKLRKNAATPEFYDKNGNPLGEHLSLDEALQAGEDASRAAATASGTDNEYGVAAIKGNVNADGAQTY